MRADEPALTRLGALPRAHARARLHAVPRRAAAWTASIQVPALFLLALISALRPYEGAWLKAAAATWLSWLVPLALAARAAARARSRTLAAAAAEVAEEFDRLNPDAPDVFRTALHPEAHTSAVRAALENLFARWEPRLRVPPAPRVFGADRGGRLRRGAALLAALVVLGTVPAPLLFPRLGGPGAVLARAVLPLRALDRIPAPRLAPQAMPAFVARGDTLRVLVNVRHVPRGRAVHARIRPRETNRAGARSEVRHLLPRALPEDIRSHPPDSRRSPEPGDSSGAWYVLRFGPVTEDVTVRFTALNASSPAYEVTVVEPPRLRSLAAVVTPPAYTRLPRESIPAFSGGIAVWPGTRIAWEGEADRSLARWSATWEADSGDAAAGAGGEGSAVAFSRVVHAAGALRLVLEDHAGRGGATRQEGPWRVEVRADRPPEVELEAPQGDGELPRGLKVGVAFRVTDDFGISAVRLHHVLRDAEGDAKAQGVRAVGSWRDARDGRGRGVWDGAAQGVLPAPPQPGETLELWVEAADNDAVSGPKTTRSGTVRLRLPSADEVRAEVAERERNASTALAGALRREAQRQREEEHPDRGLSAEALPQTAEWEVRRILSDEPLRHLREVGRQLEAEIRQARSAATPREEAAPGAAPRSRDAAALEALKKELQAMEARVPAPGIANAPARERARALDDLHRDQKTLQKRLKDVRPQKEPTSADGARRGEQATRENRQRLEDELSRQLADQQNLKTWLAEEQRRQEVRAQREAAAARQREQAQADVEDALRELETAMKKGLENGTLGPDLLEKMDRVRELLEEVLDEEQREKMGHEARAPSPSGDLERALREMSGRPGDMRRELERAIDMLETLRDAKALRELAADMRALGEKQAELAKRVDEGSGGESTADQGLDKGESPAEGKPGAQAGTAKPEELAARQDALVRELERHMNRQETLEAQAARKDSPRESAQSASRQAHDEMKRARDEFRKPRPDRKKGSASANLAAQKLAAAAAQMEQAAARMDQGANQAETRDVFEETLEFARWLEAWNGPGAAAGPSRDDMQSVARVARWLARRMDALAAARAFEGDVLKRHAASLTAHADALSTRDAHPSPATLAPVRAQARGAARELLKWLNESQEGGGGNDEGDGQGDNDFGGGEQGESGEEGTQGMARRMRGISGQQMAANRMTEQLLRSLMEEREERRRNPGGGSPGPGQTGGSPLESGAPTSGGGSGEGGRGEGRQTRASGQPQTGQSGSGPSGGQGGGQERGGTGGEKGGNEAGGEGHDGEGAAGTDRARGAAANAQQQVADALESLAESADDAGGAARALRRLAEEARALERALRGGRLDEAELRKRQERFRTRLLESADAQEERGRQRERRAEAYRGGGLVFEGPALPVDSLAEELRRRREDARRLPLTPEQKRRVEWYYERLLGE